MPRTAVTVSPPENPVLAQAQAADQTMLAVLAARETVERIGAAPSEVPAGKIAIKALRALPFFLDGVEPGELLLVAEKLGQHLCDQNPPLARRTYADVYVATQHTGGVLVGNKIVTREAPVLCAYDDALAAVNVCDRGDSRAGGLFAGSVRIITEEDAKQWDPASLPADPRPAIARKPHPMESPCTRVRSNFTGDFLGMPFRDEEEASVNEWAACVGLLRQNRHGEAKLSLVGELTSRGRRFLEALKAFVQRTPGWNTESQNFPDYYAY